MMGGGGTGASGGGSAISTLIMLFIIFLVPLSWVIPIIVKKTRKKPDGFIKNQTKNHNPEKTPSQQPNSSFVFCTNCGKQYDACRIGKFCSSCGGKILL